jgi:hypothetical protein
MFRFSRHMAEESRRSRAQDQRQDKERDRPSALIAQTIQKLCNSVERREADEARRVSTKRRVSYAYRRYREQQRQRHKPVEFWYMFSVIRTESALATSPVERSEDEMARLLRLYTQRVLRLWLCVKPYLADDKYSIVFHTVAALYCLKEGLVDRNQQIIVRDPVLDTLLPHIQDIDVIGFVKRSVTRHTEMFRGAYVRYFNEHGHPSM